MMFIQNVVLIFIASVIAGVIYIVDFQTGSSLAVASLYALVILYNWLLPSKYASIYAAIGCSFLTILSTTTQSVEMSVDSSELSHLNTIISLVVIWICVMLVMIAKSSFTSLENSNRDLTKNSSMLLEKVKELDEKQQELSRHKVKLEELNGELKVKNQELERFTSIASHDLQEPLRTIGNMTQLIDKKYHNQIDEQGKKMLNYVSTATTRMTNLIKGLLDFSRIGNNRQIQVVDIQELVSTIREDLDAILKTVNGTIHFKNLPKIKGHPLELRVLFQNLISNGLKFKKQDTPPSVEIFAQEKPTHFEFCVKDNGIGIDDAHYEKIFLIFQRLHSLDDFEGTGLGLAYCRKIVELHGGKIWINSKKEVGSSFFFTIEKNI